MECTLERKLDDTRHGKEGGFRWLRRVSEWVGFNGERGGYRMWKNWKTGGGTGGRLTEYIELISNKKKRTYSKCERS